MRSIPIPRYFIFTLEDSTWVVQRGAESVQELLTGKERLHSPLDSTYAITDVELDLLMAQGIVERYDESYVWLRETQHTEGIVSMNALERPLGLSIFYYVGVDLPASEIDTVQALLEDLGLDDRYQAGTRWGKVIVMDNNGEPFMQLGTADDAQILLSPHLRHLQSSSQVESIRFDSSVLASPWQDMPVTHDQPLISKLAPKLKQHTIVCVDDEEVTHEIVRDVLRTWDVQVYSAYNGQDALNLIADVDPALIITDLKLPDMHGYQIVAHVRNHPDLHHTPLIIISAIDTAADRLFAYDIAHATDFMAKPFSGEDMRRKVWRVISAPLSAQKPLT